MQLVAPVLRFEEICSKRHPSIISPIPHLFDRIRHCSPKDLQNPALPKNNKTPNNSAGMGVSKTDFLRATAVQAGSAEVAY